MDGTQLSFLDGAADKPSLKKLVAFQQEVRARVGYTIRFKDFGRGTDYTLRFATDDASITRIFRLMHRLYQNNPPEFIYHRAGETVARMTPAEISMVYTQLEDYRQKTLAVMHQAYLQIDEGRIETVEHLETLPWPKDSV